MSNKQTWPAVAGYALLIVCDTCSQLLFKSASVDAGHVAFDSVARFSDFLLALLRQPALAGAILLLLIAFFCWMHLVSQADLSRAHLISCLSYATVPLCAQYVFADHIGPAQAMGIGLITVGAALSAVA